MRTMKLNPGKYVWSLIFIFMLTNCSDSVKSQQAAVHETKSRKIQIALLLDTSNSMDGLIEQAKSQLWNIVNELAKATCEGERPELQIALYEYGNDNLAQEEGFIRLVTSLTSDLDEISKDLFELTTYGGDEYCGQVIDKAMRQLKWTQKDKDLQIIYIAGNEPFTQGKMDFKTVCQNAKEKNVIVNTIFCGPFQEGINTSWKSGADLTGGSYSSIEQNKRTVYIKSPYDDRITTLNKKLNETYVPYGTKGKEKKNNQLMQDSNAESYGSVNTVKRAVSKSSHVYKNTSWDLVDAAEEEDFKLDKIKPSSLPEEMQNMTEQERKAYIKKKKEEREKIKTEIQELNSKRGTYVAEQKEGKTDDEMLEKAVVSPLKSQAKAKGFVIE